MATGTGPAALEEAVEQTLHTAADTVERGAAEICAEMADVLVREIHEVPDDEQTRADVVRRGEAQLKILVSEFRRGVRPEDSQPPSEALAYARLLARRSVPLDVFLRIHRLSFGVMLRGWEDRMGAAVSADVLLAATRRSIDHLFAHHDVLIERLSADYQGERERFVRSADALRRETIQSVLAEQPIDVDRAGSVLGHDLRRHHVGLVLWAATWEDQPAVAPRLERAAAEAAEWFGTSRALLLAEGTGTMWGWLALDAQPSHNLMDGFVGRANRDGVSIAIGEPAHGVTGFRQTHRDAIDAARVARLGKRRPGSVTAYRAVELPALLAGDIDRARRFVLEHLGPLAREDDEMARLRATLLPYLEESGSRIATSRRLGIHPNTVAHRIRACRDLLDRDLSRRQVRLQVALGLAASLGPAVLRPD